MYWDRNQASLNLRLILRYLFLLYGLTLLSQQGFGQKVALVLSGGGAKGLAHVGVLKVLEENHIPVDYIVGTSMGGVIGGFYAAGYSPQEIETLVLDERFQEWVDGELGTEFNFYYARKEDNASIINLNLAVDSSVNLNTNLANDFAINYALTEFLTQASQRSGYNFDKLFVPFRAVASDIFTQRQMVLKDGRLNEALRATLSVPFFFRPLKVTDKYLFDGGIYNNFPVDIARRDFKPDVIIGVNVSSKVFDEYPYEQDEELIQQSLLSMLLDKPNVNQLTEQDIYLEPDIQPYSSLDFEDVAALIDSGYVEAQRHLKVIKKKIPQYRSCDSIAEARIDFVLGAEPLRFKNIHISGFKEAQKRYIRRLFNDQEYLTTYDIKTGYYKMISEDYFQNIVPGMVYNSVDSAYDFEISGEGKSRLHVEFGGNISSRSISQIFLGVNFTHFNRYLFKHSLNFYTGRFYQSFQAASRINLPTSKPFYVEPVFTFNHWDYLDANELILQEKDPTIIDEIDRNGRLNLGFAVGTRGRLRVHGSYFNNTNRYSNNNIFVSSDTLDELRFDGGRYGIDFSRYNLNRKQYASSGHHLSVSLDHFRAQERLSPGSTSLFSEEQKKRNNWVRFKVHSQQYFGSGRFKYGYLVEGVFSNQSTSFDLKATRINAPAFSPMVDSPTLFLENFRAHNYIGGGIRNVYSITRDIDFRLEGYIFKPFREFEAGEDAGVVLSNDLTKLYFAGTAATVYHSPLGPIGLQVNYYDDSENQLGVLLHVGYVLFNKRALE